MNQYYYLIQKLLIYLSQSCLLLMLVQFALLTNRVLHSLHVILGDCQTTALLTNYTCQLSSIATKRQGLTWKVCYWKLYKLYSSPLGRRQTFFSSFIVFSFLYFSFCNYDSIWGCDNWREKFLNSKDQSKSHKDTRTPKFSEHYRFEQKIKIT